MDTLQAIATRRSIRQFHDQPVPGEFVRKLLGAAMCAPSAGNAQPWQFLVLSEPAALAELTRLPPLREMPRQFPLAILVCGDVSLELFVGHWVLDCAAAVQNLLLAAHSLGLGAVWVGVYPRKDRIEALRQRFHLPEHIVPHTLVPVGYAAEQPAVENRFQEQRIHRNRW